MVKIMNRTTKSTSSLANIFLTGMVVIGFYILYRYVKSLELDLKQLKIENSNVKNTITSLENMMYTNSTNYSNININDINKLINTQYPDIRSIINNLITTTIDFDISNKDFIYNFNLLIDKNKSWDLRFSLGSNEQFTQIPIFHENYILQKINNKDINRISNYISECDIVHTHIYIHQKYELMYLCTTLGILFPAFFFNKRMSSSLTLFISDEGNDM